MAEGYQNIGGLAVIQHLSWGTYSGEIDLNGSMIKNRLCSAAFGPDGKYQVLFMPGNFGPGEYTDVNVGGNLVRIRLLSPTKIKVTAPDDTSVPAYSLRVLNTMPLVGW